MKNWTGSRIFASPENVRGDKAEEQSSVRGGMQASLEGFKHQWGASESVLVVRSLPYLAKASCSILKVLPINECNGSGVCSIDVSHYCV